MSYFAILHSPPSELEVVHAHINVWMLPAVRGGKPQTLFDVGVGIACDADRGEFRLALPFESADQKSLHVEIQEPATATVVFGERVTGHPEHKGVMVKRTGEDFDVREAVLDAQHNPGDGREVWRVSFTRAEGIPKYIPVYVRLRFVLKPGNSSVIQDSGKGRTLDLRIADSRSVPAQDAWDEFSEQIVSLSRVQIFTVAPATMRLNTQHPEYKYIRVLESGVWNTYLDEQPQEKMTVYYWNAPPKEPSGTGKQDRKPINAESPFMGFMSLERPDSWVERAVHPVAAGATGAIVMLIAASLAGYPPRLADQAYRYLQTLFTSLPDTNTLGSLASIAGLFLAIPGAIWWVWRHGRRAWQLRSSTSTLRKP